MLTVQDRTGPLVERNIHSIVLDILQLDITLPPSKGQSVNQSKSTRKGPANCMPNNFNLSFYKEKAEQFQQLGESPDDNTVIICYNVLFMRTGTGTGNHSLTLIPKKNCLKTGI